MGLQKSTIPKAGQGVIARPLACLAERTFPVGLRVACNGHKCRIPSGDGEAVDCSKSCFDILLPSGNVRGEQSMQNVLSVALRFRVSKQKGVL